MITNANIQLSKWWQSDSAQRAIERAALQRRERIEVMKRAVAQRKAELQTAVEQWEEK